MTTASDLLTATNAAILKTLTSQEYNLPGGQRQRMADLRDLQELRQQLMDEVSNSGDGGGSMCSLISMGDAE
jgi:ABC-type iron transport system FetAB ATPase subunit